VTARGVGGTGHMRRAAPGEPGLVWPGPAPEYTPPGSPSPFILSLAARAPRGRVYRRRSKRSQVD